MFEYASGASLVASDRGTIEGGLQIVLPRDPDAETTESGATTPHQFDAPIESCEFSTDMYAGH